MNTLTVHAERCVHQVVAQADCNMCVRSCPQSAWQINDQGLSFDDALCDACGLCVAACPCEALALPQATPLLRMKPAGKDLLIACERAAPAAFAAALARSTCQSGRAGQMSGPVQTVAARLPRMDDSKPTAGTASCLQALTPHWVLHWAGPYAGSRLRYASGDCQQCARGRGPAWQERYAPVAASLQAAGRPAPQLQHITFEAWQQEAAREMAPDTGRRSLLRAILRPPGAAAAATPAQDTTSARTPLLQLLRARGAGRVLWAVALDRERCTWCMACVRLCPRGALQLTTDAATTDTGYLPPAHRAGRTVAAHFTLDMLACTGCGVCVCSCDQQALRRIAAPDPDQAVRTHIALQRSLCTQCGVFFYHLPRLPAPRQAPSDIAATTREAPLCPACRQGRPPQHDRRVQNGEGA